MDIKAQATIYREAQTEYLDAAWIAGFEAANVHVSLTRLAAIARAAQEYLDETPNIHGPGTSPFIYRQKLEAALQELSK